MNFASRVEKIPPYLFVEISRKIARKRAEGIEVISFGIGDPISKRPRPSLTSCATPPETCPIIAILSPRASPSSERPPPTGISEGSASPSTPRMRSSR